MKTFKPVSFIIIIAVIFTTGCIPKWKAIKQSELSAKNANFRITAPMGWIQLEGLDKITFITKEGPGIQKIWIEQTHREKAFQALFSEKETKLEKDVMVTELAEYYIANFKMMNQGFQVTHKETLPAVIDQKQGFKILMGYANAEGLVFDVVVYGFMHDDYVYTLFFQAPRLYYFERDLPVFESVKESFVLI